MNATFGFGLPRPAARAVIHAGAGAKGTRGTANRGVAIIGQRMPGQVMGIKIGIDIIFTPMREGVELEPPCRISLPNRPVSEGGGLMSLVARDP